MSELSAVGQMHRFEIFVFTKYHNLGWLTLKTWNLG